MIYRCCGGEWENDDACSGGGGRNTAVGLINILLHCGGNRGEI